MTWLLLWRELWNGGSKSVMNILSVILDFVPKPKEVIYRMLFGTEMLTDNQDKSTLSELKNDLMEEIGNAYGVNIVGKNQLLKKRLNKISRSLSV